MSQIFEDLQQEWHQHVTSHFRHVSPTITGSEPPAQPPQEEPMSLTAGLTAAQDTARAAAAANVQLVDQHFPPLIEAAQLYDGSRLIQAAINVEHALADPAMKDILAGLLEAHAQAAPAPEQQPA